VTNIAWPMAEFAARSLEPTERDAILGDLIEVGETGWSALQNVLGLIILRQAQLLRTLRPWVAGLGVGLPSCYLLMGVSASVACTYERLFKPQVVRSPWWPTANEGILLLLCHFFLLLAWSWTAGYLCASLSRRTLWVTAALGFAPWFIDNFHLAPLPKSCVLLFVIPLVLGVLHGLQGTRISPLLALFLAIAMTGVMIFCWTNGALWNFNWALLVPAWYLVSVALRTAEQMGPEGSRLPA